MRARRELPVIVPPAMPAGGRIAVIAPGSVTCRAALSPGIQQLRAWGYEVVLGRQLYAKDGDLAGSDTARAEDLRWALEAPGIDAIWAARGGWGSARLLKLVDLSVLRETPRWLIGFSDLSVLLLRLLDLGVASWHAPLVSDLAHAERFVPADLKAMLETPRAPRVFRPGTRAVLVPGKARGRLAGGCLTMLVSLVGTSWQPVLRDRIVFLEEVQEPPYRVDRLLWQAAEAGLFDGVRGLVFGHFTRCHAAPSRASRPLSRVLLDFARERGVPALRGISAGHGRKARALPLGYEASLDAEAGVLRIQPGEVADS